MAAPMEEVLNTLQEQLRPPRAALVVVDMQNDFCAEGGYLESARRGSATTGIRVDDNVRIADRIAGLARAMREAGAPVVWLRSVYDFDFLNEAQRVKRGVEGCCLEGTWGADFFRIRPQDGDIVVDKHSFSGFHDTALHEILREHDVRTLVMTGVATNVCVDSTLREGFFLGYHIVVVEDCVGSGNRQAHEGTLSTVRLNFGTVIDSGVLLEQLAAPAPACSASST